MFARGIFNCMPIYALIPIIFRNNKLTLTTIVHYMQSGDIYSTLHIISQLHKNHGSSPTSARTLNISTILFLNNISQSSLYEIL